MKIALVSQDFPPDVGGVQVYAHQLALKFSRRHKVTVIAPRQKDSNAFDAVQPYKSMRHHAGHTSLFGMTTLASVPYFSRLRKAEVVFCAQYATGFGPVAAKRFGWIKRYYVAAHAREILRDNLGSLSRAARKKVLMGASGVFAVSRYTAGLVQNLGVPPHKVHVVPNGVDLNFFYPRNIENAKERLGLKNKRVILTAGRMIKRKGIDTVIKAFKQIEAGYPNLVYIVVGDGAYRSELENLAGSLADRGRIIFTGRINREDLADYYSLADLFVMPSREEARGCVEGFGLVFLEANACGVPVIGGLSGGIPDAVEHDVNGLLVRPTDELALASAIKELLGNDKKRLQLGRQGRERAKRFTWDACAQAILEKIESNDS
ncbi:MAG: glycosyltransferase family 4 protein [Proteobacteria bacterium]|nr:glycosyltransferase family 4 protein [Pseudomonadota bacterium]